ncbi:MAG TPA: TIGR03618 family F420-dependent PPOX class oxidoreductase [Tepidiformaceae bacterium]|nr:TIGR03618 family F420-dependent PPOX class oxidoreductase [Tepidiformaceae bacterium]
MIGTAEQDAFVSEMRQAIVTTLRRDGSPTSSLVAYCRDGDEIVFSTTKDRLKAKTVAHDPRVVVAILDGESKGRFVSVEGNGTVQRDEVAAGHVLLNRHMRGNPDWTPPEGFADKLKADGRVLIRIRANRVSGVIGRG